GAEPWPLATGAAPYELYDRLRRQAPVSWSAALGGWLVVRHADVRTALADPRLRAARTQTFLGDVPGRARDRHAQFHAMRGRMLFFLDGPEHARRRWRVVEALRPSTADEESRRLAGIADRLLDDLLARGAFDVVTEFARPFALLALTSL